MSIVLVLILQVVGSPPQQMQVPVPDIKTCIAQQQKFLEESAKDGSFAVFASGCLVKKGEAQ